VAGHTQVSRFPLNFTLADYILRHHLNQVSPREIDQPLNVGLLEILLELLQGHLILEPQFPCFADVHLVRSKLARLRGKPCDFHHLTGEVGEVDRGLSGLSGLAGGLAGHVCSPLVLGYRFLSSYRHLYPTI